MKAIGYQQPGSPDALVDITLPDPTPGPFDLLVEVRAVSVNPVDTKVRRNTEPPSGEWKVLGWDAVGVVRAVGASVQRFRPHDRVWYAGAINRAGCNSELHLVDERLVALAPKSLSDAQAAALPLTAITAWELLFDRLQVNSKSSGDERSLLIIGAAGGVGSVLIQLARTLTGLTVIGTASRPETMQWVLDLGAHAVIDHSKPLHAELARAGLETPPHYVVSLTHSESHFAAVAELIAPQGKVGLIDDPPKGSIDINLLKRKSVSLHWELMFTRSLFQTSDMAEQQTLLSEVSALVDRGSLRTTLQDHFGTICAKNLKRAHALIESGKAKGKIVLEGF